jgi:hypothetical protein
MTSNIARQWQWQWQWQCYHNIFSLLEKNEYLEHHFALWIDRPTNPWESLSISYRKIQSHNNGCISAQSANCAEKSM